jgi:hypothetical protein
MIIKNRHVSSNLITLGKVEGKTQIMKKRYARIYGRFSSKPQEDGDSKRRQIDGALAYAEKNGIELVKGNDGNPLVYFDEGVSGKAGLNLEKEFGRLLADASVTIKNATPGWRHYVSILVLVSFHEVVSLLHC